MNTVGAKYQTQSGGGLRRLGTKEFGLPSLPQAAVRLGWCENKYFYLLAKGFCSRDKMC